MELACCPKLLDIIIKASDPFVPIEWTGKIGSDDNLTQLHNAMPSLRRVSWNEVSTLTTVVSEPIWSCSPFDERHRYSKGELLKLREKVKDQPANVKGTELDNQRSHPTPGPSN